jgi:transmembrane sensor
MSTTRRLTSRLSAGEHWRLAAAFVGVALLGITVWQLSSHGYPPTQHGLSQQGQNQYAEYRTRIGEQRTVELSDHSQIMLDAATRIRVRLSGDARLVQLDAGQAEFHVVKDIARPFRVQVDGDTITDLGTVFNVNRTEGGADIAVIEGRVSVDRGRTSADAGTVPQQKQGPIQLSAGEELSVNRNGPMYLNQHADLASLSAWRQGLVIIRNEPLSQAVRRFNRYSTVQIEIQGNGLAAERIGGVFKAGDTQGFIRAIGLYQPVTADYSRNGTVLLKPAPATPQ